MRICATWGHKRKKRTAVLNGLRRLMQLISTGMRGERIRTLRRYIFELIRNSRQLTLEFIDYQMVFTDILFDIRQSITDMLKL